MELTQETREVRTAGVGQAVQATIRATAKVFNFFSDMTYSNKVEAVLRELVANAIDAHKMAGNPEPITVILPTEADPVLRVKDQGVGMSHEFMVGQFMAYTDGTTKSDNNLAIGGFGIGSKSPFAYTDQFLIRSVHEGKFGVYSVFKDAEGIPSILPMELGDTNEPNGVEVMVAVEPDDFARFKSTAETILAFFDPRPTLVNGEIKEPDYIAQGEGWAVRRQAGELRIIMGGVRYPVSDYGLPSDIRRDELISYGIDLTLPIGTVSVAISREGLSLDDKSTNEIAKALVAVKAQIIESFSTMFDNCPSKWAAMKMLAEETSGNTARGRLLSQHAKYKGEDLPVFLRPRGVDVWAANNRGRKSTMQRPDFIYGGAVYPGKVKHLIIDDLPVGPKSRTVARIRHRFEGDLEYAKDIYVLRGESAQAVLDAIGNPTSEEFVLTSSLPVPPPQPRAARATRTSEPRLFYCNGSYPSQSTLGELRSAGCGERDVIVVMNNYSLPEGFSKKWRSLLVSRSRVVFVNLRDSKHESLQHLTPFDDAYNEAYLKFIAEKGEDLAVVRGVRENRDLQALFGHLRFINFEKLGELTPAQKKRPFGKVVALYEQYGKHDEPVGMDLVKPKLPYRLNPTKLREKFEKDHAKAMLLLNNWQVMREDLGHEIIKELV